MSLTEAEAPLEAHIRQVIGPPPSPDEFGLTSEELHEIQNRPPSIFRRFMEPKGTVSLFVFCIVFIWLLPVLFLCMFVYASFESYFPWFHHPKEKQYQLYVAARQKYSARREQTESAYERKRQDFWLGLGGREFEEEVAALLRKKGHTVRTTAVSGDEGVDLVVDDSTVVQCKQHAKPVAPAVVRDLAGTRQYFGAKRAILISSRGFTTGATAFAGKVDIELWDVHTLIDMQDELN